jgi:AraC-like DNA-binding protein
LSVPCGEFADKTVDLTLIQPQFNRLWHQLYAVDFGRRIALINQWISRAYRAPRDLDKAIGGFLATPIRDLSVSGLSAQFCSSRRNLSRKFNQLLGMCTEEAVLYKKYLHSLESVHATDLPFTEIAYRSCFYDQSHFNREFRRYSGLTPKEYRKRRGPVCGHIYSSGD